MSDLKIGLALSGGGARGFCHIGVLKVLEEHGIKPYAITGTSMGAIVGGIYASGASLSDLIEFSENIRNDKIADWNLFNIYRNSLFKGRKARKIFEKFAKVENIEDCPTKFSCVAFDVKSGKKIIFDKGNLVENIYSSMAVPALFRPLEKDGMLLIDGGVLNNMPHELLKDMGCDLIICVDAIGEYDGYKYKKNAVNSIINVMNIFIREQQKFLADSNNIVITPKLDGLMSFNFNKETAIKAMQEGEIAAKESIDAIIEAIRKLKGD